MIAFPSLETMRVNDAEAGLKWRRWQILAVAFVTDLSPRAIIITEALSSTIIAFYPSACPVYAFQAFHAVIVRLTLISIIL